MKNKIVISLMILIVWITLIFTNNINWFDDGVYNFLISFKSDIFTNVMKIITSFSNVKVMIILSCLSLVGLIWKRKESLYLVGTLGGSTLVNIILKNVFRRDRPLLFRFIEETGFSFPSGHAMGSMAFYGAIIVLIINSKINKKYKYLIGILLGLLIFLIGVSRIYLGVHYPSDIIGGWLIGFIILNILNEMLKRRNYESINYRSK